jgi:hypothetical protein
VIVKTHGLRPTRMNSGGKITMKQLRNYRSPAATL